jgi:hypothetical protein
MSRPAVTLNFGRFQNSNHVGAAIASLAQVQKKAFDFQHNAIPCVHAVAVCLHCKKDPLKYVSELFSAGNYRKLYSGAIPPVNFSDLRGESSVLPPITKKPRGRPKKTRIRSRGEQKQPGRPSKRGRCGAAQKCSRCNQVGHNQRTCKMPI